jgi:hypothetical protein
MSFLGESLQDLLMVSARPSTDKKGIILQMREVNGKPVTIAVTDPFPSSGTLVSSTHAKSAFEVNVLEEVVQPISGTLQIKPFETKFIKLEF